MKQSILPSILPLLAATALWSNPALAQEVPTPEQQAEYQRKIFELVDANNDGKITENEFAVITLWDDFRIYDANGDGKVTKAEYDKVPKEEDLWTQLDPAGAGYVTFESCLKSPVVIKALRDDWKNLLKTLNRPGAAYITKADLPDLAAQ